MQVIVIIKIRDKVSFTKSNHPNEISFIKLNAEGTLIAVSHTEVYNIVWMISIYYYLGDYNICS